MNDNPLDGRAGSVSAPAVVHHQPRPRAPDEHQRPAADAHAPPSARGRERGATEPRAHRKTRRRARSAGDVEVVLRLAHPDTTATRARPLATCSSTGCALLRPAQRDRAARARLPPRSRAAPPRVAALSRLSRLPSLAFCAAAEPPGHGLRRPLSIGAGSCRARRALSGDGLRRGLRISLPSPGSERPSLGQHVRASIDAMHAST